MAFSRYLNTRYILFVHHARALARSLKARRDTLPPRTFISALLSAEDPLTGGPLSDDRLKAEVAFLIFAGWVHAHIGGGGRLCRVMHGGHVRQWHAARMSVWGWHSIVRRGVSLQ